MEQKYSLNMEKFKQKDSQAITRYPAPYSQSWAGIGHKKSFKERTPCKIITSPKRLPRKPESPDCSGLDTTLPHLKYGLFAKKSCMSRGQSRILTKPWYSIRSNNPLSRRDETKDWWNNDFSRGPPVSRTPTIQKLMNPKSHSELADVPVLVFRPLARGDLRTLTISESTHLDIKPRPPHHCGRYLH